MKSLLIATFCFFQFAAGAQIYIPLKIVNGVATFEASADAPGLSAEDIHKRTLKWLEETFLAQDILTQNTPERLVARYTQDYATDSWSNSFQHNLQIDILDKKAVFTITDTGLGLVRDGAWKEHLAKMRVMFEQTVNELFWSYQDGLKKPVKNK